MVETIEIKQQVKEAFYEFFREEQSGLFRDTILEEIEDIALCKAMEEGDKGNFVEEEKVFLLI